MSQPKLEWEDAAKVEGERGWSWKASKRGRLWPYLWKINKIYYHGADVSLYHLSDYESGEFVESFSTLESAQAEAERRTL